MGNYQNNGALDLSSWWTFKPISAATVNFLTSTLQMLHGIGIHWPIHVYVYVIYSTTKTCMHVDIIISSNYIIKVLLSIIEGGTYTVVFHSCQLIIRISSFSLIKECLQIAEQLHEVGVYSAYFVAEYWLLFFVKFPYIRTKSLTTWIKMNHSISI